MGGQETRVTKINSVKVVVPTAACLVQIYGPEIGKRYTIESVELTVGREFDNDIVVELDNVSRRHCRFFTRAGSIFVSDLGSTNGTYLNEEEIVGDAPLKSGDLIKVGGSIFKFLSGGNVEAQYHEEIYRATIMDGLTQVHNKRYFLEYLDKEMGRAHRHSNPLSLIMFDIDHFKRVNDEHGHLAGDAVLIELARIIKVRVRREECMARYGGEEFAIVLPETNLEKALTFANTIHGMVAHHTFKFDQLTLPITISMGVAAMAPEHTEPNQFIKAADELLYRAKHEGRNRICS